MELGFWIPIVSVILDSLSCIPDSKTQDSGFQSTISRITESGFSYMGRKIAGNCPYSKRLGTCVGELLDLFLLLPTFYGRPHTEMSTSIFLLNVKRRTKQEGNEE